MSEFVTKLGIKESQTVVVLDEESELFRRLSLEFPSTVTLQKRILGIPVDMIIIRIMQKVEYEQLFQRLRRAIKPDGAVWAVIQKKSVALKKGGNVFWDEMMEGVLKTDLVDNKTLSFNDEEYGTRLVVRKVLRQ
ncbi:MAG: hypothetical protein IID12_03955 [Candidatus Marinimicrobia bacterium]|nr:hypothetical protein [Candidatus Neomarinimicrobiota bacterium]